MKNIILNLTILLFFTFLSNFIIAQPIIIDHTCAKLDPIPANAIQTAKDNLHIAYGHTSHGSQLITGMTSLIGQTNLLGYKGDIYRWNDGGLDGALDIDDKFTGWADLGHNGDTDWADDTRTYLNDAANSDVNVVIWSWCGGVADNTEEGINTYLTTMNQLEIDYIDVKFVYMTGHAQIGSDYNLKARNKQIRDYCIANNKILYDFYDIETYDPDAKFFEFVNDNCRYYDAADGTGHVGQWAEEWRNTHTEGTDWYDCSPSHTDALNGNLKAYAAWWLWCKLAGWNNSTTSITKLKKNEIIAFPNPTNGIFKINKNKYNTKSIIEILNSNGKVIYKGKIIDNIDISNQADGVYYINIIEKNKVYKSKIIKN